MSDRERPARVEVTLRLHPKLVEMLDAQASAAGLSRQRHIGRLIQDRQWHVDNERDMALLAKLGPDPESDAIVAWTGAHPVDLGPAWEHDTEPPSTT